MDLLEIARRADAEWKALHSGGMDDLEAILSGWALELWSDATGSMFIVSDEGSARKLGERRSRTLTARELRLVVTISDPDVAREVMAWKRTFDGTISGGTFHENRQAET